MRSTQLRQILEHIRANYNLVPGYELTLEGNPDNFTKPYVEEAQGLGFNRFSLGVQSLDDKVNKETGRKHSRAQSLESIQHLKATRRPFNVDTIYGLVGQTPESYAETVETLIQHGVPTITTYRLRNNNRKELHVGTVSNYNKQPQQWPDWQTTYAMRECAMELLYKSSYRPSPACFWSLPGTYEGSANLPRVYRNKWMQLDNQIAFGPGVYGWLSNGPSGELFQYHNTLGLHDYSKMIESGSSALTTGRLMKGPQAVAAALGFGYKSMQPIVVDDYRRNSRLISSERSHMPPF